MKKQSIINMVKYYVEKNDSAFRGEVMEIAKDFEKNGDFEISSYLMDLIATTNYYEPQNNYKELVFLKNHTNKNTPLFLPDRIRDDIIGIVKSANKDLCVSKVLFYGEPGTGKTESAYQIARLMNRELLIVRMEDLIDSHLGQTSKNIVSMFDEIKHLHSYNIVVLFDELDSLVMNRVCSNDLREMGRVTSTFLKELEDVSNRILIIATTNLVDSFDKALLRRFDAKISFNRYTKQDLIDISCEILQGMIKKAKNSKADMRLFKKILNNCTNLPYPGDMIQLIKISLAFSSEDNEFDYLKRFYYELNDGEDVSIQSLTKKGFTTREIEILTGIPKSSVSRKLKEE